MIRTHGHECSVEGACQQLKAAEYRLLANKVRMLVFKYVRINKGCRISCLHSAGVAWPHARLRQCRSLKEPLRHFRPNGNGVVDTG